MLFNINTPGAHLSTLAGMIEHHAQSVGDSASWEAEQVGADQSFEDDRELQARRAISGRFHNFRLAAGAEASHAK
ncbi:MAG: hypothetical protein AB7L90_25900 [Hyphomicrobiaceae bacterium]